MRVAAQVPPRGSPRRAPAAYPQVLPAQGSPGAAPRFADPAPLQEPLADYTHADADAVAQMQEAKAKWFEHKNMHGTLNLAANPHLEPLDFRGSEPGAGFRDARPSGMRGLHHMYEGPSDWQMHKLENEKKAMYAKELQEQMRVKEAEKAREKAQREREEEEEERKYRQYLEEVKQEQAATASPRGRAKGDLQSPSQLRPVGPGGAWTGLK